jgi:transcriptional regulator with XRE-family HTH domain
MSKTKKKQARVRLASRPGQRKTRAVKVVMVSGGRAGARVALGIPKGVKIEVTQVRTQLGLTQVELARVTGYSLRSIAGWETGKPLSGPARQKLIETDRLAAALSEILPPNGAGEWLRTPNPAFEGQTPIQIIERGETDRLWRMISQIDAGVAS